MSPDPALPPAARRAPREWGLGSEGMGEAERAGEGRSPDGKEGRKAGTKKIWEEERERGVKGRKERGEEERQTLGKRSK